MSVSAELQATVATSAGWRVSRRGRKALLVIHLITALGWLGADFGQLALGITTATGSTRMGQAAVVATSQVDTWVVGPLAVLAVITGILLALATGWGVFRQVWVLVSLVLTVAAAVLVIVLLGPTMRHLATEVLAAPVTQPVSQTIEGTMRMITPPCGELVVLIVITTINVYKPWGRDNSVR